MIENAEISVVGGLLVEPSKIKEVRQIVKHEDFLDKKLQVVFRAMEWLDNQGREVDIVTLSDALVKNKVSSLVGGAAYLADLTSKVPTATRIMTYARMVAEDASRRNLIEAASSGESLEETLNNLKNRIHEANNIDGGNKYQVTSMLDHIEEAESRFANWGKLQGMSTGFPSIDELTLGLVGGELIIIAGLTSRGKTTLAMNITNNIAKTGKTVLFVTLEMTHAELTSRYMYINGGSGTRDFEEVACNTLFQANDELGWKDVDGLIENARDQLGVDIVIIDHLHYFSRGENNVSEVLGMVTKEFKKNAIRHNIPVILISHVRKLGENEKLSGESLRGSSLIAQDADIVLLVDRDPETNAMGVMIDKNRNRGKLSDRTKNWEGKDEREINTVYLEFNETKLKDPKQLPPQVQELFPGAKALT